MRDIVSRIIYKIQQIALTKTYELYFWVVACGAVSSIGMSYMSHQYNTDFYSGVLITLFVYYSGYKLILE